LGKATVKDFCGFVVNPVTVFAVILLTGIICVGAPETKGGGEQGGAEGVTEGSTDNSERTAEQSGEWQIVRMRVTAYCPCRRCCGRFADGKTASGHKVRKGDVLVAADKKYRFGTEMRVPGYNKGRPVKVLDRGRVIRGNRLDVFFNSHKRAKKWGVKYLDVEIRRAGQHN